MKFEWIEKIIVALLLALAVYFIFKRVTKKDKGCDKC
jgi:uncharacterized membrane protein YfcA